jgi:hypothetical protein
MERPNGSLQRRSTNVVNNNIKPENGAAKQKKRIRHLPYEFPTETNTNSPAACTYRPPEPMQRPPFRLYEVSETVKKTVDTERPFDVANALRLKVPEDLVTKYPSMDALVSKFSGPGANRVRVQREINSPLQGRGDDTSEQSHALTTLVENVDIRNEIRKEATSVFQTLKAAQVSFCLPNGEYLLSGWFVHICD